MRGGQPRARLPPFPSALAGARASPASRAFCSSPSPGAPDSRAGPRCSLDPSGHPRGSSALSSVCCCGDRFPRDCGGCGLIPLRGGAPSESCRDLEPRLQGGEGGPGEGAVPLAQTCRAGSHRGLFWNLQMACCRRHTRPACGFFILKYTDC